MYGLSPTYRRPRPPGPPLGQSSSYAHRPRESPRGAPGDARPGALPRGSISRARAAVPGRVSPGVSAVVPDRVSPFVSAAWVIHFLRRAGKGSSFNLQVPTTPIQKNQVQSEEGMFLLIIIIIIASSIYMYLPI